MLSLYETKTFSVLFYLLFVLILKFHVTLGGCVIVTSKENFVFLQETCYLDDLIHLNALKNMTANMHAVKSVHSMGSNDNADLIFCIMRFVWVLPIAKSLLNDCMSYMHLPVSNMYSVLILIPRYLMVVVFICLMIQRDLIRKLWGLHYSGVIHGNLNPQNVLVFEGECMLTSIINDGRYFVFYLCICSWF